MTRVLIKIETFLQRVSPLTRAVHAANSRWRARWRLLPCGKFCVQLSRRTASSRADETSERPAGRAVKLMAVKLRSRLFLRNFIFWRCIFNSTATPWFINLQCWWGRCVFCKCKSAIYTFACGPSADGWCSLHTSWFLLFIISTFFLSQFLGWYCFHISRSYVSTVCVCWNCHLFDYRNFPAAFLFTPNPTESNLV